MVRSLKFTGHNEILGYCVATLQHSNIYTSILALIYTYTRKYWEIVAALSGLKATKYELADTAAAKIPL